MIQDHLPDGRKYRLAALPLPKCRVPRPIVALESSVVLFGLQPCPHRHLSPRHEIEYPSAPERQAFEVRGQSFRLSTRGKGASLVFARRRRGTTQIASMLLGVVGVRARQSQPAAGMLLICASPQVILGATNHQPIGGHHTSSGGARPSGAWLPRQRAFQRDSTVRCLWEASAAVNRRWLSDTSAGRTHPANRLGGRP